MSDNASCACPPKLTTHLRLWHRFSMHWVQCCPNVPPCLDDICCAPATAGRTAGSTAGRTAGSACTSRTGPWRCVPVLKAIHVKFRSWSTLVFGAIPRCKSSRQILQPIKQRSGVRHHPHRRLPTATVPQLRMLRKFACPPLIRE